MKLYRSQKSFWLFGLCGGIAEATGVSTALVRLTVALAVILSCGFLIVPYMALCILIPKRPLPATQPATAWSWDWSNEESPSSDAAGDAKRCALQQQIDAIRDKLSRYEKLLHEAETGLGR